MGITQVTVFAAAIWRGSPEWQGFWQLHVDGSTSVTHYYITCHHILGGFTYISSSYLRGEPQGDFENCGFT